MVIYSKAKQNIPITDIQADLRSITYNYGSRAVLPLCTPEGTDSIFPDLINADRFEDHPNILLFPSVKAFTEGMQCEILSARMLNLTSGSIIKEHRDAELAFEKGKARLHIPIQTNAEIYRLRS